MLKPGSSKLAEAEVKILDEMKDFEKQEDLTLRNFEEAMANVTGEEEATSNNADDNETDETVQLLSGKDSNNTSRESIVDGSEKQTKAEYKDTLKEKITSHPDSGEARDHGQAETEVKESANAIADGFDEEQDEADHDKIKEEGSYRKLKYRTMTSGKETKSNEGRKSADWKKGGSSWQEAGWKTPGWDNGDKEKIMGYGKSIDEQLESLARQKGDAKWSSDKNGAKWKSGGRSKWGATWKESSGLTDLSSLDEANTISQLLFRHNVSRTGGKIINWMIQNMPDGQQAIVVL